jgi:hypothetical protein
VATRDTKSGDPDAAEPAAASKPAGARDAVDAAEEPFRPKRLPEILSELWHQKPGTRKVKPGQEAKVLSTKEVVNGLEPKEAILGAVLMAIDLVITVAVYLIWRHSSQAKFRHYAPDFLIAGLIGVGILAFGAALRRRALLGFASFIVGMELISFGLVYGIFYLFFGGWLIVRVMRYQRQQSAIGKYSGTVDTGPRRREHPVAPSASKRYTPPRKTRVAPKAKRAPRAAR